MIDLMIAELTLFSRSAPPTLHYQFCTRFKHVWRDLSCDINIRAEDG